MSWLDPERLAALYGKQPLKRAEPAPMLTKETAAKALKKAKKKERKALKAAKKAAKHVHTHEHVAHKLVRPRKAVCCEKFKYGKRCKDCPMG
jgi:hypothetical protein